MDDEVDPSTDTRLVKAARVMAHSYGGHWSIFLILENNDPAPRVNMTPDFEQDPIGSEIVWEPHDRWNEPWFFYQVWDYTMAKGKKVRDIYEFVRNQELAAYKFVPESVSKIVGCRFWVYVTMKLLQKERFLTIDPFEPGPASLLSIIQMEYSRTENPKPSRVRPGEFTGAKSKEFSNKYEDDFSR
ncbi:hypothetical protein MMC07_006833 [Pseudocyphellaria aurata]|nr:hypothetical protein [Pseudocyphellaria aurata]